MIGLDLFSKVAASTSRHGRLHVITTQPLRVLLLQQRQVATYRTLLPSRPSTPSMPTPRLSLAALAYTLSFSVLFLTAVSVARASGRVQPHSVICAAVAVLLGAVGATGIAGPLNRRDADDSFEAEKLAFRPAFAVANHRGAYISGRIALAGDGNGGRKG